MTAMKLTREDKEPAEILPGLYLGSIGAAFNKESLEKHKITHILTCADKIQARFPNVSYQTPKAYRFHRTTHICFYQY
jgi:hypothetical protein